MQKKWYTSKTVWINVVSVAGIMLQSQFGFLITPDMQVMLLGLLNVAVRTVTKEEITW